MRVVVVHPPFSWYSYYPPLGAATLLGCINDAFPSGEVDFRSLDLSLLYPTRRTGSHLLPANSEERRAVIPEAVTAILALAPNVVLLSVYRSGAQITLELASQLKLADPELFVALGGPLFRWWSTDLADEVFLRYGGSFDVLMFGEGDESVPALLRALMNHEGMDVLAGACFPSGHGPKWRNACRPSVPPFQSPPTPIFDASTLKRYEYPVLPVMATRGCSWGRCRFCSHVRAYRERTPSQLVDELHCQVRRYGITAFHFHDNLLNGSRSFLRDLCMELIMRGPAIRWMCQARPTLTREEISLMKEAGCRSICFGCESGSQTVLDGMDKGVRRGAIAAALEGASALGVGVSTTWIAGFPGETKEDALATREFLEECRGLMDLAMVSEFSPQLGSRIVAEHPQKWPRRVLSDVCTGPRNEESLGIWDETLRLLTDWGVLSYSFHDELRLFLQPNGDWYGSGST